MTDGEKIIVVLKIGKLDLSIRDLDMSLDQDLPWKDAFELKDLRLLFNREIEEDQDPYRKGGIDFDERTLVVGEMVVGKLTAISEDITLHLEDSTGSVDLRSEKQSVELENLKTEALKLILTEATIAETVVKKLIGCDFGVSMFPPSAGLSCVNEANVVMKDFTSTLVLGDDFEEEIDEIAGNLCFEELYVSGEGSSIMDLEVDEEEVDLEELNSKSSDMDLEVDDFNFDLENLILDFGSLKLRNGSVEGVSMDVKDYSRELGDLIGNLRGMVSRGIEIVEEE